MWDVLFILSVILVIGWVGGKYDSPYANNPNAHPDRDRRYTNL